MPEYRVIGMPQPVRFSCFSFRYFLNYILSQFFIVFLRTTELWFGTSDCTGLSSDMFCAHVEVVGTFPRKLQPKWKRIGEREKRFWIVLRLITPTKHLTTACIVFGFQPTFHLAKAFKGKVRYFIFSIRKYIISLLRRIATAKTEKNIFSHHKNFIWYLLQNNMNKIRVLDHM